MCVFPLYVFAFFLLQFTSALGVGMLLYSFTSCLAFSSCQSNTFLHLCVCVPVSLDAPSSLVDPTKICLDVEDPLARPLRRLVCSCQNPCMVL